MAKSLIGKKVAVLVAHGFEQSEFTEPVKALQKAGADIDVISPEEGGVVKAWQQGDWARDFKIDKSVYEARAGDYDALLLPGGIINPDRLRRNHRAVEFVRSFFLGDQPKPVAAICHGPWILINAGVLKNRTLTSYESIKTDIENAEAHWVDKKVVIDNGLITSRSPNDLPYFCEHIVEEFAAPPARNRKDVVNKENQIIYY